MTLAAYEWPKNLVTYTDFAGVKSHVLMKKLPKEARPIWTADFVKDMDQLIDSFNGTTMKPKNRKEYRKCIFDGSEHMSFWQKMILKIKKWKFIDREASEGQKETYIS